MNVIEEAAMRSRMQARGALVNAMAPPLHTPLTSPAPMHPVYVPSIPFLPLLPQQALPQQAHTAAPSQSAHINPTSASVDALARPATSPASSATLGAGTQPFPSSVTTMDRCRSLKERIHDRRGSATQRLELGAEPTKDVYAHSAPFPPSAVYEVERVSMNRSNPNFTPTANSNISQDILRHLSSAKLVDRNGRQDDQHDKDVLLMATECASVVRELQDQLAGEKHRSAELENLLRKCETEVKAARDAAEASEKARQQWAERHAALDAVYQMEKRQWSEILTAERQQGANTNQEQINHLILEHRSLIDSTQSEAKNQQLRADRLQADCDRFQHVIHELKEQLNANSTAVSTSSTAVDKLTRELLLAKQQATFISTGYKKQDGELRALRQQVAAQAEELAKYRAIAAEHAVLVAQRNDANARLEAMHHQVAENPILKAELAALKEAHSKLTVEFESKSARAAELKEILDDIRNQANDAYLQTKGFNNMADAMSPARMGGDPMLAGMLGGYNNAMADAHLESLRREIELERQRAEDEKRRWKERVEGR